VVIQLKHHEGIPVEHTLARNRRHPAMKQESQPFTVEQSAASCLTTKSWTTRSAKSWAVRV